MTALTHEERFAQLNIELPVAPKPAANYTTFKRSGQLAFISGQGPIVGGEVIYKGAVGADISEEDGYKAARLATLNAIAVLRSTLGSLDEVSQVVRLTVWVRGNFGFARQHLVANGASDLLVEVFGEHGTHTRCAVGAPDLPFGIPVEIELTVELAAGA